MADEHVFALSLEASGEVTPAAAAEPEQTDEAQPPAEDEELTDG